MIENMQLTMHYTSDFTGLRREAARLKAENNQIIGGMATVANEAVGHFRKLKTEIAAVNAARDRMNAGWQRMQKDMRTTVQQNTPVSYPGLPTYQEPSKNKYPNAISPYVKKQMENRNFERNAVPALWAAGELAANIGLWGLSSAFPPAGVAGKAGLAAVRATAGKALSRSLTGLSVFQGLKSAGAYGRENNEIEFLANYGQRQVEVQKWLGLTDEQTRSLWMDDVRKALDKKNSQSGQSYGPVDDFRTAFDYKRTLLKKIAYNESVGRWETGRMNPSLQQPEEAAAFDSLPQIYDRYEEYYRGINNLATESAEQATKTQAWSADEIYKVLVTSYDAAKQKSSEVGQHQTQQILLASNSAAQAYQFLGQAQAQVSTKMVEDWDQAALDIEGGFAELGDMQIDLAAEAAGAQIDTAQATQDQLWSISQTGLNARQDLEVGFVSTFQNLWSGAYSALDNMIYGFVTGQEGVWDKFVANLKGLLFNQLFGFVTSGLKSLLGNIMSGLGNIVGKLFSGSGGFKKGIMAF